jgi:predicted dehydrogenase
MSRIRWGLLSTSGIGRVVTEATRGAQRTEFVAVASRDGAKARRFAHEVGLAASYGSYEELLARDDVDAVYVALPVSLHTEWTVAALRAGKHVLCEKPFAVTAAAAASCFDAAEEAGRVCVEGFMYRHHPQTVLTRRLISEGAIGRPALIRSALEVVGTDERITVPDPWLCRGGFVELTDGDGTRRIPVGDPDPYGVEFETVSAAIADGGELEFGRRDAVGQAATLEALRRSAEQGQAVDVAPL